MLEVKTAHAAQIIIKFWSFKGISFYLLATVLQV